MKILTIVGARPQFIKAAAVSHTFKKFNDIEEVILHTGQHFDKNMSNVFFDELGIPLPKFNLNLGGLSHGAMTGRILEGVERICLEEKPDAVLVYGDTNSTLAGALAAKKMHIKVAHVEAGLRSFNMKMPEEVNRILTDRISDYLFCPTEEAIINLSNEGLNNCDIHIENTGDVMYDAISIFSNASKKPLICLNNNFVLCTLHRAENTDSPEKLRSIFAAINEIGSTYQVVIPIHPRTKKVIENLKIMLTDNITLIEPVSYFEMIYLLKEAMIILTDSGGLQKEAFFMKKACVTLRDETEWPELVNSKFNILVGSDSQNIISGFHNQLSKKHNYDQAQHFYGKGNAAELIAISLLK
jgi:UDP-GlcNAc3NAcA epimerase